MSELVCVETFPDRLEAEMAKTLLEANGINAAFSADDAGGMRPDLGFTSGGVKLFVLDENVERAVELLTSISPRESESRQPVGAVETAIFCYHCGAVLPEQLAKCPVCARELDWS